MEQDSNLYKHKTELLLLMGCKLQKIYTVEKRCTGLILTIQRKGGEFFNSLLKHFILFNEKNGFSQVWTWKDAYCQTVFQDV